jgi:hypothetical protein
VNPNNIEVSVGFDTLKKRIDLVGGTLQYTTPEDTLNQFVIRLPSMD